MSSKQRGNFERLTTFCRRYFNAQLKLYYQLKRKAKPPTGQRDTAQNFLVQALTIEKEDTTPIITLKLLIFWLMIQRIGRDAVALIPENWAAKALVDRPQLKVIYRVDGRSTSGNYDLTIPHYNGSPNPKFPAYTKGRFWARLTLKDNSKIVVYAKSTAEAERVLKVLKQYVSPKFLTDVVVTGEVSTKDTERFKQVRVVPIRADYFDKGLKNPVPAKRYYFRNI
jgi:hypothetical protein